MIRSLLFPHSSFLVVLTAVRQHRCDLSHDRDPYRLLSERLIAAPRCLQLISFMLVPSRFHVVPVVWGPPLSVDSCSRFESSLAPLDYLSLGSLLFVRSAGCLESSRAPFGQSCLGSLSSIRACASFGSSVSLRSYGRFDSASFVFGSASFESLVSILNSVLVGSSLSLSEDTFSFGVVAVCYKPCTFRALFVCDRFFATRLASAFTQVCTCRVILPHLWRSAIW